ncbi:MAG: hypothetical protein RO257_17310 [Candidatus Kapabacteria bacterium]|jgi:hypothetical protein|nr:hypothetical protein [Candidatus Kapabacteria bacterium]
MKTIIIFLLAATIAFSQTREPVQQTFKIFDNNQNYVNILLNSSNDYFKLKNFQIGWHWGSMRVLSQSLLMNQGDISTEITPNPYFHLGDFNDSTNYFVRAYYDTIINGEPKQGHLYSHTVYDNSIVFTNGMNYDPSLYINPSDTFKLNIRTGDPQNPIFGRRKWELGNRN